MNTDNYKTKQTNKIKTNIKKNTIKLTHNIIIQTNNTINTNNIKQQKNNINTNKYKQKTTIKLTHTNIKQKNTIKLTQNI